MPDDRGVLRAVSWRDLFPWLIIFRSFGVSIGVPVLFLATVAVLIQPLGWRCSRLLFIDNATPREASAFQEVVERNDRWAGQPGASGAPANLRTAPSFTSGSWLGSSPLAKVFVEPFVEPFARLFDIRLTPTNFAYLLFGGLWTLVLWSFFGGAITRIAVMQMGREERVGLKEAVLHAVRKFTAYFTAPLFPLLGVVLISLPIALLGLFMLSDPGTLIAGLFWIFVILGGFIMTVLLLGLLFGWPLMWCTISSEGTDAFDALSRSYAYTFQRPLHYLFYVVVAAIFGALAWTLVYLFSEALIEVTYWAASWGAGRERLMEVRSVAEGTTFASGPLWAGAGLIGWCVGLVRLVAAAFSYSFFWCVASAIYLLLRRDVDQTEFDEIFLEDEEDPYGLPPLKSDLPGSKETEKPLEPAAAGDVKTADGSARGESESDPTELE